MKKLLLLLVVPLLMGVSCTKGQNNKVVSDLINSNQQVEAKQKLIETLENQINIADNKLRTKIPHVYTFKSPNLKYTLYLYNHTDSTGNFCLSELRDGQGNGNSILNNMLKEVDFSCHNEMYFYSKFVGWSADSKIIVKENKGSVVIIDVDKKEISRYTYDPQKYLFMSVNKTLKYWLFKKITVTDKISYIILDGNQKVIKDNIDFVANDRGVQYDYANDGFLFINRTYKDSVVSVEFSFLSLKDLKIKNILTTEPLKEEGRGCIPEYLISQPGEIIMTQGCLPVGDKYLELDGNIHIKL